MEIEGLDLNKVSAGAGNNSRSSDGFIDRSKVKILLCDNNTKSSQEVLTLLLGCSYQVTSVRSARQVIDALNAEGQDIDIILAEVDLPMKKGMKMLKYIARDKDLHRIPVITSDPSDANTNSTTLFSDDTEEDKSRRSTNPEIGISIQQEHEASSIVAISVADVHGESQDARASEYRPDVPGISDRRKGHFASGPKKSELRIGESSAFFSYVKSTMQKINSPGIARVDSNAATPSRIEDMRQACAQQVVYDLQTHENGETYESPSQDDLPSSNSIPDSFSVERSSTPPASMEILKQKHVKEDHLPHGMIHQRNGTHGSETEVSGVVNHVLMPSSSQLYLKNLQDLQNHASTTMIAQYNNISQCPPHATRIASFPYYPMNLCLQPGQMSSAHSWPSYGSSSSSEVKLNNKVDRREAALMKFRQKRKERCFDKKIRYVNRKRLAERRPRVRGQFDMSELMIQSVTSTIEVQTNSFLNDASLQALREFIAPASCIGCDSNSANPQIHVSTVHRSRCWKRFSSRVSSSSRRLPVISALPVVSALLFKLVFSTQPSLQK
ncbi:Two-component response regulator-like APRR1 [Senna tora]|uniref:Two-component response regulator-like APRR1 n=1 Tax=Senna tora TaxID=362788 RepID=A0A834X530_9FABA|nr:Two-component response regulator-like APRR1 [Senna tora]